MVWWCVTCGFGGDLNQDFGVMGDWVEFRGRVRLRGLLIGVGGVKADFFCSSFFG